MNYVARIYAFIDDHAGKVGAGGFFSALTVDQWSKLASLLVAVLTIIALVPVAWSRWAKLLKGKDAE